ncbi:MAG: GbsR/MarR family transcriptional regulator [Bacteroidota bacterium]
MIRKGMREHIEETGRVFEKFGLTPMQGRIMAYIANSDRPEATFSELVDFFRASKSSISTSLNYLMSVKMIDYKTRASERRKYFFITDGFFRIYFMQLLDNIQELKELCYKTVSMRSAEYPEVSEKILKWIEGANIFEESIQNVLNNIKRL